MGISVYKDKSVIIDHSHQELVDTSVEGNPTEGLIAGLRLQYVFRRKSTKDHDRDGNPLVYALKEMHGYRMQPMYRRMLDRISDEILRKFVGQIDSEILIDVPSSNPLCRDFASHVSQVSGIPLIDSTFLRKKTVGEILGQVDANFPEIHRDRDMADFKAELGPLRLIDPVVDFQMKQIAKPVRSYFQPFTLRAEPPALQGKRVALVDDLVSSGASIISTANLLREYGAIVEDGVCLLSGLNARRARS